MPVLIAGTFFLALTPACGFAADPICKPPVNNTGNAWSDWLKRQEVAGGHAMACHSGVTTNGLISRLDPRKNNQNQTGVCITGGAAASTWSGNKALLDAVKPVVTAHWAEVSSGAAGNYAYSGGGADTVGTTVTRYDGKPDKNRNACSGNSDYVCTKAKSWTVVLTKAANGDCYLLTAYPQ